MASLNKVMLIGHLGQEPNLTTMTNGEGACSLSVATSKKWQDKHSGETVEKTEWHRVVLYRTLAEIAGKYLRKGSQVYIEGELQTRKWTDKDGIERYTTEIIGSSLKMLGKKEDSSNQPTPSNTAPQSKTNGDVMTEDEQKDFDDLPF